MEEIEKTEQPKINTIYRGQAWVELHGNFTIGELEVLIEELKSKCEGLKKNGI